MRIRTWQEWLGEARGIPGITDWQPGGGLEDLEGLRRDLVPLMPWLRQQAEQHDLNLKEVELRSPSKVGFAIAPLKWMNPFTLSGRVGKFMKELESVFGSMDPGDVAKLSTSVGVKGGGDVRLREPLPPQRLRAVARMVAGIFEEQEPREEGGPEGLAPSVIAWLDECAKGTWQFNAQTGLVDVQGDFSCSQQGLDSFKGVRFGHVSRDFSCYKNNLTSLEGAPQSVGENFYCRNNNLTSLEGAPQSVGGGFFCSGNNLTSLEGAPQSVGGDFWCRDNNLTSLEGAPQSVDGNFVCYGNKLTSLKGFPMEIGGDIDLEANPIWDQIGPMVKSMSDGDKRFFYKFAAVDQTGTAESLERIARSIERMRMI